MYPDTTSSLNYEQSDATQSASTIEKKETEETTPSTGIIQLLLEIGLGGIEKATPPVPFPIFSEDNLQAFKRIKDKLGFDPHRANLDVAKLEMVKRPSDISEGAWETVMNQLLLEIHYRNLCRLYFDSLHNFVQNVFIGQSNIVEDAGRMIQIEDSDKLLIIYEGMCKGVAKALVEFECPGAEAVGFAVDLMFQAANEALKVEKDLTVTLHEASKNLTDIFDNMISLIQNTREAVFTDWAKLRRLGEALESDDGDYHWPTDDIELRQIARKKLEIEVWKSILKSKWHNQIYSGPPEFVKNYNDDIKKAYEKTYPQHWIKYWAGTQKTAFGKRKNGFFVEDHWLGYGSAVPLNKVADKVIGEYLFETLGVTRSEVFTDASWGLKSEICHAPDYNNHFPGY